MPYEQCRSMNPLGTRCTMTPAPGSRFCLFHSHEDVPSISGSDADANASAVLPDRERTDSTRRYGGTEFSDTGVVRGETAGWTPPTPPDIPSNSVSPSEPGPTTRFAGTPSATPPLRVETADPPTEEMEWLQALLRQAMTEVMAGEGTPLQKASAIARLGNLYLKAHGAAELKRDNQELRRQTAALEERLAAAEARFAALAATQAADGADSTPQADGAPYAASTSTGRVAMPLVPRSEAAPRCAPDELGQSFLALDDGRAAATG